jgi:hypothetical protein
MIGQNYLVIKAIGEPGEESMSINPITDTDIFFLLPLIDRLRQLPGSNYPTGNFYTPGLMYSPEDLYGDLECFGVFDKMVPNASSGINRIDEILIVSESQKLL